MKVLVNQHLELLVEEMFPINKNGCVRQFYGRAFKVLTKGEWPPFSSRDFLMLQNNQWYWNTRPVEVEMK